MLSIQHVLTLPLGLFPAWPDASTASALDAEGQQLHSDPPLDVWALHPLWEAVPNDPCLHFSHLYHRVSFFCYLQNRIGTHPDHESWTCTGMLHHQQHDGVHHPLFAHWDWANGPVKRPNRPVAVAELCHLYNQKFWLVKNIKYKYFCMCVSDGTPGSLPALQMAEREAQHD